MKVRTTSTPGQDGASGYRLHGNRNAAPPRIPERSEIRGGAALRLPRHQWPPAPLCPGVEVTR